MINDRIYLTALLMTGADKFIDKGMMDCSSFAKYIIENIGSLPPCKIGDTFYQPYDYLNEVVEKKVSSLTLKSDGTWKIRLTSMRNKSTQEYTLSDIGKKIFESKEEAERKLNNNND